MSKDQGAGSDNVGGEGGKGAGLTPDNRAFDSVFAPLFVIIIVLVVPPNVKWLRGSATTTAGVIRQGTQRASKNQKRVVLN